MATNCGTATWSMAKFGSGLMTVREEKSTRLPDRLPRNRPPLPLRRWQKPRTCLRDCCTSFIPGKSELMSIAYCSCKCSQASLSACTSEPDAMFRSMTLFSCTISDSFMVTSSSFVPCGGSMRTDGRTHTGGASTYCVTRCSGRAFTGSSPSSRQSSSGMAARSERTCSGVRSLLALCSICASSLCSDTAALYRSGTCANRLLSDVAWAPVPPLVVVPGAHSRDAPSSSSSSPAFAKSTDV
mmetsp:Transcript_1228/g.3820  ORF Transcript_1228/g.3820 Transcript_1228/m.3820 type:complete len:241 (+) Transcript_1228:211-933(+)